jgi:hypothetical protein
MAASRARQQWAHSFPRRLGRRRRLAGLPLLLAALLATAGAPSAGASEPTPARPAAASTRFLSPWDQPWDAQSRLVTPGDLYGAGVPPAPLGAGGTQAGGWTVVRSPNPTVPNAILVSDSCTSATSCTAVGQYENGASTTLVLAEAWNGRSWTIEKTPDPAGAAASQLDAVSCTSANGCTAVGYYVDAAGYAEPLAEAWDGASWRIEDVPRPVGSPSGGLRSVSCTASAACTAVGTYENRSGRPFVLAERWGGARWTVESLPLPAGATASELFGVSCSAGDACTAAGFYDSRHGRGLTLAEAWNGSVWTVETTPDRPSASGSGFFSVSCTSASTCVAVGNYETKAFVAHPLAEIWNGRSWTMIRTYNPPRASNASLSMVSCASAVACTAVGFYEKPALPGKAHTLAEEWNGTSWSSERTRSAPHSAGSSLAAVACLAANFCLAVGNYVMTGTTLALGFSERWNGESWSAKDAADAGGGALSQLVAVSCASTALCIAVGNYSNRAGRGLALTEDWNGTAWHIQSTPDPHGSPSTSLVAVACPAPDACIAVGRYTSKKSDELSFGESWNGSKWELQHMPRPAGSVTVTLFALSCSGPTACTAVGTYSTRNGGGAMLAEAWDGHRWTLETVPNPTGGANGRLIGVSCTSAAACTAVGYYAASGMAVALAERWNGSEWRVETTATLPTGARAGALTAVSCTSGRACTGVGTYADSIGEQVTLAEAWDGSRWKIQATPNPPDAGGLNVSGVSCTAARACTAVGFYYGDNGTSSFAEARNGDAWALQTVPGPVGATTSGLSAVSCASASACTAVGSYSGSSGVSVTLALSE